MFLGKSPGLLEHPVWNMSYRKDHRNDKIKLMKDYLYTNQLK